MLKNLTIYNHMLIFFIRLPIVLCIKKGKEMGNSPSIGDIGLNVDRKNSRVKIICEEVFSSIEQVIETLIAIISNNREAIDLIGMPNSRITCRAILSPKEETRPFKIGSLEVREEARISSQERDIVYFGGNGTQRFDPLLFKKEDNLSRAVTESFIDVPCPENVVFERLEFPILERDINSLIEMYSLCFTSYLVFLNEGFFQNAAKNSIFIVARNERKEIIASAVGESLRVGPITLLEVSEEAAHPILRIRGAATSCAARVILEGKRILEPPVIPFWEARMWRNILGMGPRVGLTKYAGILHQHCKIASPADLTTLPNKGGFGSLAVFYAP